VGPRRDKLEELSKSGGAGSRTLLRCGIRDPFVSEPYLRVLVRKNRLDRCRKKVLQTREHNGRKREDLGICAL